MGFEDRRGAEASLVETVDDRIWTVAPLASHLTVVKYGYETHIPESIRGMLRYARSTTTKHIRFTPDFFVVDDRKPDQAYLLEYKATQTPLYLASRIRMISEESGVAGLTWQDISQMEADAYDNYKRLADAGVRVAILNYCAYHARPLLCDFVENIQILHRDVVTSGTITGSRTPFVNFYAPSMRTLDRFISDEHGLTIPTEHYAGALAEIREKLPTEHHSRSPLYKARP